MNTQVHRFSNGKILEILSLSQNATAIYTGHNLIIQTANQAMVGFWGKDQSIIGLPLQQAVPELEGQPFIGILQEVWRTGITYEAKDTPADLCIDGKMQLFYFDFVYRAITNTAGETECILHTATDVTERNAGRLAMQQAREAQAALEREQALNEELATANEELFQTQANLNELNSELEERVTTRTRALAESEARVRYLVADAPVAIGVLAGWDMVIESANAKILEVWGKPARVIGLPLEEAMPELKGQPFIDILRNVLTTDTPFYGNEFKTMLVRSHGLEEVYFNFVYHPLKDGSGKPVSIMVVATEVSEQVKARHKVQVLNDQLSVANKEQEKAQLALLQVNRQLQASQYMLDQILKRMPAPIVVLRGPNQVVETINDSLLAFWQKNREDVLGKPILEVFPELASQPFPKLWNQALETGETISSHERMLYYNRPDGKHVYYVNYHYQPLADLDGNITSILATLIDVTHVVKARKTVEQAEANLRLATESAGLGTWILDMNTNEFLPSARLKELFGFRADEDMPFDAAIAQVVDEHRDTFMKDMEQAIGSGEKYTMEYPVTGYHDKKTRWVRAVGKTDKEQNLFTGVLMDITEQRRDDQRKNDFIGMVSHELKTPLTSLNAYLQILLQKARKASDPFTTTALEKSTRQVKKMTTMINGFLNVSRLESGKIHIEKRSFDMAELVKETEEESIATVTSHKVIFAPVLTTYVNADRDKIGHVINNLISNAVKYSPPDSTINIACVTVDGQAVVSVSDEGMGIAPQDVDKLFERYYRTENVAASSVSGFGIGLYLCAEIIQRHDGCIWVESQLGKGSTFRFSLPVEKW